MIDVVGMIEIRKKLSVSVIIPAHNEEKGIAAVVNAAKHVNEVDEIIVVNDGSVDNTSRVAKKCGARVVDLDENRGKGYAIRRGLEKAKGDVLIFLDADLANINPLKILKIIEPFRDMCDFVKTKFDRAGGRVTRLTAKPLLGHFFPEIEKSFEQPLSGQFGIRKDLIKRIHLEDDFGVDVGILIDVVQMGAKTKEVYFGRLTHDERNLSELDNTAKQVSRVILDRAAKYNRLEEGIELIQSV
jgi:glucosyl-3-phosphoglycerate synthase